ncbi:MAG: two-component regulator propeller domain-containing protein, partial [Bacteroidota bacterium]
EDQKGNIWIGGGQFYQFNGQHFYDYNIDPSNRKTIFGITEDQEGNIWYGGNSNQITKFDGKTFTHYELYPQIIKNQTGYKDIRALRTDKNGAIWIATQTMGLYRFDGQSFVRYTTKEGLSSNQIVSLMEDQIGNLWIGTYDGGLNKFDGEQFTTFTTKEGLSSNRIWTITEDPSGNIWVGADQCLNQLVFETGTLKRVGVYCNMGGEMKSEFFANSTLLDSEGRMWWGTESTTIMIDSKQLPVYEKAARVSLNEVRLNQQFVDFRILADSIAAGKNWWLDEDENINLNTIQFDSVVAFQNCPLNLKLPHYVNSLSFQFTGSHHPNLHELKFSFFIEGIDQTWSAPSLSNTAEYRSLNPGIYTLKVKTAGNENIWSTPFEYTFMILPPWWQTTWAYALWLGIILTCIYLLYRYLLRQRLKEVEASRLLEMDRLKTNLYNNITHEFRTPLTIIMGISDTIKGNREEKNIIKRNSGDLLQ